MATQGEAMGPDSVGALPGTIGAGDFESTPDIGGTPDRNDRTGLEDLGRELEDDHGIDREINAAVIEKMLVGASDKSQSAQRQNTDAADKAAEMAEAHAEGNAYYWGDTTYEGETVQEWILPNGTTILVDDEGQAVSIDYPPGEGPIYVGDITYQGEPHAVYEMPGGSQVVIDDDGDVIGELDDLDYSITVPLGVLTKDIDDITGGEMVTITVTPLGPPSYDTVIVDTETGEVYDRIDTGDKDVLGAEVGQWEADEVNAEYSTYQPPGAGYALVIDAEGSVVDTIQIPAEPEWSILGVVEYYEDGTVVVDVGAVEVSVDVIGPEGGISVDFDVLIAEGTAGIEWNEDGSWDFSVSADLDIQAAEVGVGVGFGQDAKGNGYLDIETTLDMTLGVMHIEGGQHLHVQETDDGFEFNIGMEGKIEAFGAYLSREQDLSVVFGDDGLTTTYQDTIGAGINGLGGIEFTSHTQVRTDGTLGGTSATQGVDAAVVDADGERLVGGGVYVDTKDGAFTSSEILGDGRDYERDDDEPELPVAPDGGADFEFSDGSHPEPDLPVDLDLPTAKSQGGLGRDVFEAVAADTDARDRSAQEPQGGPSRTSERDLGLDESRQPVGTAGGATQTTERNLGLDEQRDPIGTAGGDSDDAGSTRNGRGFDPDQQLIDRAAGADGDDPSSAPSPQAQEESDSNDKGDKGGKPKKPDLEPKPESGGTHSKPDPSPNPGPGGVERPVLAGPGFDPDKEVPEIELTRVWDGEGDDDDDLVGRGPSKGDGGRPGDGPPVIHLATSDAVNISSPPPPPPPEPSEDKDEPERPEINLKRDPDAPDPKPNGDPDGPKDLPPLKDRNGDPVPPSDGPSDRPVLAGPDFDPSKPGPPINLERVWDGPGDDDDDVFGTPGSGPTSGGRPGDGPPVIHLTSSDAANISSPPPPLNESDSALSSMSGAGNELFSTSGAGNELYSMDAGTTDVVLDEAGAGLPHKSVARDIDAAKPVADSIEPRLGDRGGDDTDSASDTDIPVDDITTMTTGEGAGGGTDGLEVGRATRSVDISPWGPDPVTIEGDFAYEAAESNEPFVPEGTFVFERVDGAADTDADGAVGADTQTAAQIDPAVTRAGVTQVETAIPARQTPAAGIAESGSGVATPHPDPDPDPGSPPVPGPDPEPDPDPDSPPVPDPEPEPIPLPEPEPEPVPEPEAIEHQPMLEPEPAPEFMVDDAFDDDMDI